MGLRCFPAFFFGGFEGLRWGPGVPRSSFAHRRAAETLPSLNSGAQGGGGGEPSGSPTEVTSFCPVYNCSFCEHNCHYLMEAPNKEWLWSLGAPPSSSCSAPQPPRALPGGVGAGVQRVEIRLRAAQEEGEGRAERGSELTQSVDAGFSFFQWILSQPRCKWEWSWVGASQVGRVAVGRHEVGIWACCVLGALQFCCSALGFR